MTGLSRNKVDDYCAQMETVSDLVMFCYKNATFMEPEAKLAVRKQAKKLMGMDVDPESGLLEGHGTGKAAE